jgi:hypothetical protein
MCMYKVLSMTTQRTAPELELEWEDPPVKTGNGRGRQVNPKLASIVTELQSNPDKWAKVAIYKSGSSASALAGRITKGQSPWAPEGTFEAMSRAGVVYAKYTGPATDAPTGDAAAAPVVSPAPEAPVVTESAEQPSNTGW